MKLFACGVAFALAVASEHVAAADMHNAPDLFQFGVAPTNASSRSIDEAHFVYIPVIGPWMDIGKFGATASLVFDGVCQDIVGLAFMTKMLATRGGPEPRPLTSAWNVTPWFPVSGGGGLSLKATF